MNTAVTASHTAMATTQNTAQPFTLRAGSGHGLGSTGPGTAHDGAALAASLSEFFATPPA